LSSTDHAIESGDFVRANPPAQVKPYAWYVLAVLVLVYILNFVDRQILTILAEDLKRDLKLTDSDLGFLYGTAFGVFYSLFGIPLGKLADSWSRIRLMSAGLTIWSSMTMVSGFSSSLGQLAGARVGVGVGEATASPCAYSLISDYFPRQKRATALAIYTSGLYLGGGLSLFIGGAVVKQWNLAFPAGSGPLGLVGWQAAFLAVGLPGLLLALWVATLKEPVRGLIDGVPSAPSTAPFKAFRDELIAVIPPFTLIGAWRRGGAAFAINIAVASLVAGLASLLFQVTGDGKQWAAVGLGVYAVFSWATTLKERDRPAFQMIWGTPAFLLVVVGYGLISFTAYSVSAFAPAYAIRTFGAEPQTAGFLLGGIGAAGGALGVITGGWVADQLRKTNPSGRIIVILVGAIGPIIPYSIAYTTSSASLYYALQLPMSLLSSAALGASAATAVDLVLPRMRGTATAAFFIGTTLLGLSMGPYLAGKISTVSGSLSTGMLALLAAAPVSITCLILAYRALPQAEASLLERARAYGEPL
jgi:MFS family permease